MKRKISLWMTMVLVVTALVVGIGVSNFLDDGNIFTQLNKIKDVLSLIQNNYVDTVDVQELTSNAITSMLSQLDPHSVYMTPRSPSRRGNGSRDRTRASASRSSW